MASEFSILPGEVNQVLTSQQISEILLKDGTILKLSPSKNECSCAEKENHNHHKDGIGLFGQHFKTEYSQNCPDCSESGVIKKRKNYVLYVSKNTTDENISKKNINCQTQKQKKETKVIYQGYPKKQEKCINQNIVLNDYAECEYVTENETKIKLGNNTQNICPECEEGEKIENANYQDPNENLCQDCYNEEQERQQVEKFTTTEKVLFPDENYLEQ
jgi:hypothetical protein